MKLGLFMMPIHNHKRDYHTTLMEDIEAIVHADGLGFSEAWVGEHYSSKSEQITSPLLFLAHLLPQTTQIVAGTGVICLPQYHPAVTAGQIAMFDHLAKGRYIAGLGPGGLPPDFEVFGVMDADRNSMMIEAIDIMIDIWTSDPPYEYNGKHWQISLKDWVYEDIGLGYMAKPYQKPYPPIAISAMSPFSGSIKFAGSQRLYPDLGELHRHVVGQVPLAGLRRGGGQGRPRDRPGDLARRAQHPRGRDRRGGRGLRQEG